MNLLKDLGSGALQVLKAVAPTLATAASGPFAPLVGPLVSKIFGTSDTASTEAALLTATPDQLLALKKAEEDFQIQMKQLGITEEKLAFDDIANARAREISTKDTTPKYMAYLITLGFFGVLGYLLAYGKPTQGGDVMLVLVGSLGTAWTGIISYYYGSSAGSAAKTDAINKIATSK